VVFANDANSATYSIDIFPTPTGSCDITGNSCGPYFPNSPWIADMAFNPNTYTMYQLEVGGGNGVFEWDPNTCEVLNYCDGVPWATSQRGIAYNPVDDVLYVGGWNEGIIYTITPPPTCELISQCAAPHASVAGIAYDFEHEILWFVTNSSPDYLYGIDPTTCAVISGPDIVDWMCGSDGYDGAGLAYVPGGKLLAVNQYDPNSHLELLNLSGFSEQCCDLWYAPFTHGWGVGFPFGMRQPTCWVSEFSDWTNYEVYAFDLYQCGDVNGVGGVTSADGYQTLNHLGDPSGFPISSCWAANVNGDSNLSSADGYHLLNYFGDPGSFPLDCQPCTPALIPKREEERAE
jgi:hypothetical protein